MMIGVSSGRGMELPCETGDHDDGEGGDGQESPRTHVCDKRGKANDDASDDAEDEHDVRHREERARSVSKAVVIGVW